MQILGKLFLKGLALVIPIGLTLALLWWLALSAERWLGALLKLMLPAKAYIPGMGVVAGVATVVLLGLLSQAIIFRRIIALGETILARVPLVKTIYSALKDFVNYFSSDTKRQFSKVVMVSLPGQTFKLVGFITRESMQGLNMPVDQERTIAVYLPMSYQIGGYTAYIDRKYVEPLDMRFEDAMRLTLTAGVSVDTSADGE